MDDLTDSEEYRAERAAIMEYDGGIPRYDAMWFASVATRDYCTRTGSPEPRDAEYRLHARMMKRDAPRYPGDTRKEYRTEIWSDNS